MRELFKKDIFIKIASVLFAILLWLTVLNKSNPFITSTPIRVRIEYRNESSLAEKGLVLMNRDSLRSYVEIFVRGRQEDISRINEGDFTVVADFSKVNSENDTVLKIEEAVHDLKNVYVYDMNPKYVTIEIEKIKKKTFPVELVSNITLKENYRIIKESVEPEIIEIEDVGSKIDAIGSVRVLVDIKDLDKNTVMKKECVIYNKDGKEIPSLSKKYSADVSIEVAKEVPIVVPVKGRPAPDYVEGAIKIAPEKALITGAADKLAKINELRTEPVDIQNISKNLNVSKLIDLPDGITLVDTPEEVAVSVVIEQLVRKDFAFSKEEISLLNTDNTDDEEPLSYEVITDSVTITVKGRQSDFPSLSKDVFNPSIDVAGLGEGTHKLPLKFFLPTAFSRVNNVEVEVKISKVVQE
jgi:YbbR domain-containing protein